MLFSPSLQPLKPTIHCPAQHRVQGQMVSPWGGDVLGVVCPSLHDSLQLWGRVSNLHAIQMGNRAQNDHPYARLGMGPAVQNHTSHENPEFYGRGGPGRAAQTHCQSAEFEVETLETWQKLSVLSVGKCQAVFRNISSSQGETG